MMRQIEIAAPGPPENLVWRDAPIPEPQSGEVLIRVHAAGVNRADLAQRQGHYPPPPGASPIPGMEVAGEITALGPDVTGWVVGGRVCALMAGGGYAEYAVAPGPQCLPIPRNLDFIAAAALPEAFFTVWANVFLLGRLHAGETLLVHGGSSGVGTIAIQLAYALGSRVITTAGSAKKCEACLLLGAEAAINYRESDFVEEVKRLTKGRGVDVILDMVGGSYTARNVECLAALGRLVQIAFLGGSKAEVDLRAVMMRRLTITGSTMRGRSVPEKGAIAEQLREQVWPLLESGKVKAVIDRVFPLRDAAAAHAYLEAGEHVGKIILDAAG